MFEDSLMESQDHLSSPNQRWTAALSLTLQCSLVAAIIALPLLHPEALPFRVDAPKIMLPLKPTPPPVPHVQATTAASKSASVPLIGHPFTGPRTIPTAIADGDEPPTSSTIGSGMGDTLGPNGMFLNAEANGPRISVVPTRPAPKSVLQISTGVSAGMLLTPITPVYPRIAATAHIERTVNLEAVISKLGHIDSAHVVSGPEMLRQSALDAIRNARYTPYLLSGSPIEVETTITVNFKLSR